MNKQVHIDDIRTSLSIEEIEASIESLIQHGAVEHPEDKYLKLAELIGQIDDCALLQRIVYRLRGRGLLQKKIGRLPIDEYSKKGKVKILASFYSLFLACEYYAAVNKSMNADIEAKYFEVFGLPYDLPHLKIDVMEGVLYFNILEIMKFVQRKMTVTDRLYADNLSITEREEFLKKMISDFNELKYNTGHDSYQSQIDYLTYALVTRPDSSVEILHKEEKHEDVFVNGGFRIWDYLMNNSVRDSRGWKTDVAHYYWMLCISTPRYIHQRPEEFKRWFERVYPSRTDVGKFRTIAVLKNIHRENQLRNAIEMYKSTKQ